MTIGVSRDPDVSSPATGGGQTRGLEVELQLTVRDIGQGSPGLATHGLGKQRTADHHRGRASILELGNALDCGSAGPT